MLNEAQCGDLSPAKDVSSLINAIREYEQLCQRINWSRIGKRGKEWLLKNRPYDKLAMEYCRFLKPKCPAMKRLFDLIIVAIICCWRCDRCLILLAFLVYIQLGIAAVLHPGPPRFVREAVQAV